MRKLILTLCAVLTSALMLSACAGPGYSRHGYAGGFPHQNALVGTALGATGGALLGGAVTQDSDGAVVGGLLGGATGGLMGHSMDRNRRPMPYPSYQPYYRPAPQPYYGGGYGHRHHYGYRHGHDD